MNQFARQENEEVYQNPGILIVYTSKFNEYGLITHDGGKSSLQLNYCPWCGYKLPASKRDSWYEGLEKLGIENVSEENVPRKFKTDEWWRKMQIN